ncbi:MAG: GHKL domain-containing protein [Elusimicrobia bacterium]|nr:GHKL domain-containing protein [Elusimicrobiota bacterium]
MSRPDAAGERWTAFRAATAARVANLALASSWLLAWRLSAGVDVSLPAAALGAAAAGWAALAWRRPQGLPPAAECAALASDLAIISWAVHWARGGPLLAQNASAVPVALAALLGPGPGAAVGAAASLAVAATQLRGLPAGGRLVPAVLAQSAVPLALGLCLGLAVRARERALLRRARAHEGVQRRHQIAEIFSGALFQVREYLSSILSVAELAERKVADEALKQRLGQLRTLVMECSGKLGRLLDSMRWATTTGRGTAYPVRIRLDAMVRDCVSETLEVSPAGGVGTLIHCDPAIELSTDAPALTLILSSVLRNALESLERRPSDRRLTVSARAVGGGAEILVADNGGGIRETDRSMAFETFFTTKAEAGGIGVGLSSASLLMDRLGGSIELSSADGQTRVLIRLPLKQEAASLTSARATWPRRRADIHGGLDGS